MASTFQLYALMTAGSMVAASPAWADVRTFEGVDQHLYLNESKDKSDTASLLAGWQAAGVHDPAMQILGRGVSALDGDVFVSKGPFRISNDRFLALIAESGADPTFVAKYRGPSFDGCGSFRTTAMINPPAPSSPRRRAA